MVIISIQVVTNRPSFPDQHKVGHLRKLKPIRPLGQPEQWMSSWHVAQQPFSKACWVHFSAENGRRSKQKKTDVPRGEDYLDCPCDS